MSKILVHRGTGTWFALDDDVWISDDQFVDPETGEIDDDILVTIGKPVVDIILLDTGKPVVDIIHDYDY